MSPRRPALARRGRGRRSPRARGSASPPHRHAERDGGVPLVGERDEQALDTQYVRTRLRGAGEHDPRGAARRPRHAYVLPPPAAHAAERLDHGLTRCEPSRIALGWRGLGLAVSHLLLGEDPGGHRRMALERAPHAAHVADVDAHADDVHGGSVAEAAAGYPAPALVPRFPSTKSTTTRAPPAASHGHTFPPAASGIATAFGAPPSVDSGPVPPAIVPETPRSAAARESSFAPYWEHRPELHTPSSSKRIRPTCCHSRTSIPQDAPDQALRTTSGSANEPTSASSTSKVQSTCCPVLISPSSAAGSSRETSVPTNAASAPCSACLGGTNAHEHAKQGAAVPATISPTAAVTIPILRSRLMSPPCLGGMCA